MAASMRTRWRIEGLSAWNIHTGDGSVDLTVPSDLNANIDASTNDGRISLGIPLRWKAVQQL